MRRNGYLSEVDYQAAVRAPLRLGPERSDTNQKQYFLDMVGDEIRANLDEGDHEGRNIYTTLDPDLQEAAEAAVRLGMEKVDRQLHARKRP
jgi:penicillin-binding protein 1B